MTLYLKNATYIDWQNFAIKNSHLSVEEGPEGNILFIETIPSADDLNSDDRVLNCAGKLVTKSFGCAHHHIYSTLADELEVNPYLRFNAEPIIALLKKRGFPVATEYERWLGVMSLE